MRTSDRFDQLLDAIYEAAIDAAGIDAVLAKLAPACGFRAAWVSFVSARAHSMRCLAAHGVAAELVETLDREHGLSVDALKALPKRAKVGEMQNRKTPRDARRRPARGAALPRNLSTGCFIVLLRSPRGVTLLHLTRARAGRPATKTQRELLVRLIPHMCRVARLVARVEDLSTQHDAYTTMADSCPFATFLLDYESSVIARNSEADRLLNSDGLILRQGQLSASQAAEDDKLQAAINATISISSAVRRPITGIDITIERPSRRTPYKLLCIPIATPSRAGRRPAAIIFVHDPTAQISIAEERLRAMHGLTGAEAKVALLVADGRSPTECARILSQKVETTRNLLKRVFSKTGASRQQELVHMLLGSTLALQIRGEANRRPAVAATKTMETAANAPDGEIRSLDFNVREIKRHRVLEVVSTGAFGNEAQMQQAAAAVRDRMRTLGYRRLLSDASRVVWQDQLRECILWGTITHEYFVGIRIAAVTDGSQYSQMSAQVASSFGAEYQAFSSRQRAMNWLLAPESPKDIRLLDRDGILHAWPLRSLLSHELQAHARYVLERAETLQRSKIALSAPQDATIDDSILLRFASYIRMMPKRVPLKIAVVAQKIDAWAIAESMSEANDSMMRVFPGSSQARDWLST